MDEHLFDLEHNGRQDRAIDCTANNDFALGQTFALGMNYWASNAGPFMWRNWQPDKVRAEIAQMRAIGCNVCRAFLFTPDFAPQPYTLLPEMLARLDEFLNYCAEAKLGVFLTLLVGHMSCENWQPSWLAGRDIYRDEEAVTWQAWYCREVVRRYRGHPAIVGWVLTNEITNYAPVPDAASGRRWLETLVSAVREVDPATPLSVGDGAWEAFGGDNGLRLEETAEQLDFLGPHTYHVDSDALRHAQTVPFLLELCQYGRPVILEEFGASTAHCSPENQAIYYRETLHSALLAGAVGALGWSYSDFDLPLQRPYSHHPHEMLFGVTDAQGQLKPAAQEISRFSRLLAEMGTAHWQTSSRQAAIVVPSAQSAWRYPFNDRDLKAINGVLLEAYVLARQAGIPVSLYREPAVSAEIETPSWDFPDDLRLLILPHNQILTAPGYEAMQRFAERGGTVYQSFHVDSAGHRFEEIFGCRQQLRYGLVETPAETVELRVVAPLGGLRPGDKLVYRSNGMPRRASYCPVEPTTARVVAVDQAGRPAILDNQLGQGHVVFSVYPLEYYIWGQANAHETDQTYRLYRSLRELAGLRQPFDSDDPWVELAWLESDGSYLLWVMNRAWQARDCQVQTPGQMYDFESINPVESPLHLEAKEVRVLRVETGR